MYVCSMPLGKANKYVVLTFIQLYLKVLVKGFSLKSKNIKGLIGCESIESVKTEERNLVWCIQILKRFSCKCESY